MDKYICIDTGTTNTRVSLCSNGKIADVLKLSVGASDTKDNPDILKRSLKSGINEVLKRNNLTENDVECIIACGMITSELGLVNLPHLKAPCGIEELANGLHNAKIPQISTLPFYFVRGVKMVGDNFYNTDVMRGEETELLGLSENIETNCLYVLPGSHSKLIQTDSKGRISKFSTELTGELMAAVTKSTILSQNIDLSENIAPDSKFLKKGYLYAKENGINSALFKVRILNNFFTTEKEKLHGFFKGAVLCGEIENILKTEVNKVVVAGKSQLREPMAYLLKEFSEKEIITVSDDISNNATAYGMVEIYKYFKGDKNGKTL